MPHDEAPIAKMTGAAKLSRERIERAIAALMGANRDARELFLDDKGQLKPAAERLFARLARDAQMDRIGFDPDARHQDYIQGRRDMVRLIARMVKLDTRRLEELQRKLGDAR